MYLNSKIQQLLVTLGKALDADLSKYEELEQNWIKNAQVQKLECCTELLWKSVKAYFEEEGETFLSPQQNMKALFTHNILNEQQYLELMRCIKNRNLLSHVYKLEMFDVIANELPIFTRLCTRLTSH